MVMADEATRCLCGLGSRLVTKEALAHATQARSSRGVLGEGILQLRRCSTVVLLIVGTHYNGKVKAARPSRLRGRAPIRREAGEPRRARPPPARCPAFAYSGSLWP
eukprot:scaffold28117_cov64-Phaeocystis_antarctica.AAC.12